MRIVLSCVACFTLVTISRADDVGIQAPDGFEVTLYADDSLAHDIYSMTIDAQGRVVVAGAGYVKILHDRDHDGTADHATLFSTKPGSGAHGMYFDGADLICTGDNSLMRLRDTDGDGAADGKPEVWTKLRHPEHGANGIVKGPDGWIYVICGNDAGLSETHAILPTSPVKTPLCGGVARFKPDGSASEVIAHGFRNPYDLDFCADGQLLTVDADGERDFHLPWYAPTRLFDIGIGLEHGWLLQGWTRSWNRPAALLDSGERLVEIGRGSPTGLVAYQHRQFPKHYRGGIFSACWTLGRVYYLPLVHDGAGYSGQRELFLETTTGTGFAPCDLAVGPTGDLFIAIGGRRTRGSVFRVRYESGQQESNRIADELTTVLESPQALSSWSRARWTPVARKLGPSPFLRAVVDVDRTTDARVRAVEVITELFDGIDVKTAEAAIQQGDPRVAARVVWSLGRQTQCEQVSEMLNRLTHHEQPPVQRAAWEAMLSQTQVNLGDAYSPAWATALNSPHRRIRTTAIWTATGPGKESYTAYRSAHPISEETGVLERIADLWVCRTDLIAADDSRNRLVQQCAACVAEHQDQRLRLDALRLVQLALGDARVQPDQAEVFTGYLAADGSRIDESVSREAAHELVECFPTGTAVVDYEIARTVGMLQVDAPGLLEHMIPLWTAQSSPEDDIHYLIVAAVVPGDRSDRFTSASAETLVRLDEKMRDRAYFPSSNWPQRVQEAFEAMCRSDNHLPRELLNHRNFGRADHTIFVRGLRDGERRSAIRLLMSRVDRDSITPDIVQLVSELASDEAQPFVRRLADEPSLRDACVLALAKKPTDEDRETFVAALASVQPRVVEEAAVALKHLKAMAGPNELISALRALRLACLAPAQRQTRQELSTLLSHWTGEKPRTEEKKGAELLATYAPWFEWFANAHPAESARLGSLAVDLSSWKTRLDHVPWDTGDINRGKAVFEKQACHRCHRQSGQLGPDLPTAVARMSRDDLLVAILEPSKEVSPTYQTTLVTTKDGKLYNGLIVYESPEGTLLQTDPDTTVRFTAQDAAQLQPSRQSLMPSGLLDTLKDQELADLYAYLKSLAAK